MNFPLTITATITQDDINRGEPAVCRSCPIARALNRALPPGFIAYVGSTVASVRSIAHDNVALGFADLGPIGEHFVDHFDDGQASALKPFTLTLTFNKAP